MAVYAENEIEDDKMKEEYVHNMPDFRGPDGENILKEIRDEKFINQLNRYSYRGGQPKSKKKKQNKKRKPFNKPRSKALSRRNRGTRKRA